MRLLAVIIVLVFGFVGTASAQQWLVVRDKAGKCEIMKTKPDTMILAGPFMSKAQAEKALKEECPHSKPGQK
jgi:hypothetical protein